MGDTLRNIEDLYPVTPMQEAMLFDALHGAGGAVNLEQFTFLLRGPLDATAYREAWTRVVHRHEALRAKFAWPEGERPLQAIERTVEVPWTEEDWSGRPEEAQAERLEAFLLQDRTRLLDVRKAPLMRFVLVRLGPDLHRVVWTFHHILVDAWSVSIILGDVDRLYDALARRAEPDLPPARRFRDVVAWVAGREADPATSAGHRRHFENALREYDTLTPLPFRRLERERVGRASSLSTERLVVPEEAFESIKTAARRLRVTIGTVILGAWSLVLARHALTREVVFGATVSGRPTELPGVEDVVGLVMNALPLRVRYDASTTRVRDYLQEVQSTVRANAPFEQTRLSIVQDACGMRGRDGLFDSLVILANYPLDDARRGGDATLSIERPRSFGWAAVPFQLMILPWRELDIEARFDAAEFAPRRVRAVLEQLRTALVELVADPDRLVAEVPILSPDESAEALSGGLGPTPSRSGDGTITGALRTRVETAPDAIAYRFDRSTLTARELDARTAAVATALRESGVLPGDPVGVCVGPGLDLPVAMIGVLRAGAAYVPLDPTYPRARLTQIAEDARPVFLIDSEASAAATPERVERTGRIEELVKTSVPEGYADAPVRAGDPAYIIYTSGSTGRPKGVRGTHVGAMNRFEWMWRTRPFETGEVTCWCTTINFVDHVWEAFGPMLAGVETVIVPQETVKDPRALVSCIAEHDISRLVVVPALLESILEHAPDLARRTPSLRILVSSGEALSATLAGRLLEAAPDVRLLNLYGSSEVAADVLAHEVTPGDILLGRIPLGRPIDHATVVLLDHDMHPTPPGSPGMIHVGGRPLADGYHGLPDLTAERFVPGPDPSLGKSTVFKTGDLARRDEQGVVEFVGRADYQVKVRGFRIELGDVEQTIASHPEVLENVVIARRHGQDNRLVAYVVGRGEAFDRDDLRRHLQTRLPGFMMPGEIVALEAVPRTPNGKVDRKALPDPAALDGGASASIEPGTVIADVTALFRDVLDRPELGPDDDFFQVGGHSLLAVKLFARIETTFRRRLPLATLMAAPTPRELATVLESKTSDRHRSPLVPILTEGDRPPFFCVHAADGDVLFLRRLRDVLPPDQPLYGLQARGMDGVETPLETVEEMAAEYVRGIQETWPEGPCIVGGYSMGGMIALEVAHRLVAEGRQVDRLVLMDTRVPGVVGELLSERTLGSRLQYRLRHRPLDFIRSKIRVEARNAAYTAFTRLGLPLPRVLRRLPTRKANLKAYFGYAPRPWAGPTTLIRAERQDHVFQSLDTFGWEHIATGGLDIVPVDCRHDDFFAASSIGHLGRALEVVLTGTRA